MEWCHYDSLVVGKFYHYENDPCDNDDDPGGCDDDVDDVDGVDDVDDDVDQDDDQTLASSFAHSTLQWLSGN